MVTPGFLNDPDRQFAILSEWNPQAPRDRHCAGHREAPLTLTLPLLMDPFNGVGGRVTGPRIEASPHEQIGMVPDV